MQVKQYHGAGMQLGHNGVSHLHGAGARPVTAVYSPVADDESQPRGNGSNPLVISPLRRPEPGACQATPDFGFDDFLTFSPKNLVSQGVVAQYVSGVSDLSH